jgi:sec-independent protein translocase protein TatA
VFQHWYVLIILGILALIIFGPRRLPELGEGLGKAIREFRKATSEMSDSLREEVRKPDSATGTTYPAPGTTYAPPVEPVPPASAPVTPPAPPAAPPETPRP